MTERENNASRGSDWRARLEGIVPPLIGTRKVMIVGCGSVGSFIAAELARSGVRSFVLIDPDTVEWANLTRTVFGHADIGRLKVDALGDHLKGIFQDISVEAHPHRIQDIQFGPDASLVQRVVNYCASAGSIVTIPTVSAPMSLPQRRHLEALVRSSAGVLARDPAAVEVGRLLIEETRREGGLRDLLGQVDLVIDAVDDPAGRGRLNRYAYAAGVSAIFVGLYVGAKGGEVLLSIPGISPCFQCATGGRRSLANLSSDRVERTRDYGTSRLVAEPALGSDIHFVCSAAVKLALSLLCVDDEKAPLGSFITRALEQRLTSVIFGMEPGYHVFPKSHDGALGQYAFQSVWMTPTSRPDCPVCGAEEFRTLPE